MFEDERKEQEREDQGDVLRSLACVAEQVLIARY